MNPNGLGHAAIMSTKVWLHRSGSVQMITSQSILRNKIPWTWNVQPGAIRSLMVSASHGSRSLPDALMAFQKATFSIKACSVPLHVGSCIPRYLAPLYRHTNHRLKTLVVDVKSTGSCTVQRMDYLFNAEVEECDGINKILYPKRGATHGSAA